MKTSEAARRLRKRVEEFSGAHMIGTSANISSTITQQLDGLTARGSLMESGIYRVHVTFLVRLNSIVADARHSALTRTRVHREWISTSLERTKVPRVSFRRLFSSAPCDTQAARCAISVPSCSYVHTQFDAQYTHIYRLHSQRHYCGIVYSRAEVSVEYNPEM